MKITIILQHGPEEESFLFLPVDIKDQIVLRDELIGKEKCKNTNILTEPTESDGAYADRISDYYLCTIYP